MLFNSYEFLFAFLPAVFAGFELLRRLGREPLAQWWLILASLGFYAYWNPRFLPVLLVSMTVSYSIARRLMRAPRDDERRRQRLLVAGIAFNLLLLGYFKYTNFFLDTLRSGFGLDLAVGRIVLPIGISFYTFQKIALLVDSHRGRAEELDLRSYALFVTFFPQLIAGPIVHHSEVVPQFRRPSPGPALPRLAIGATILVIGLFKKVVIADSVAVASDALFAHASNGVLPGLLDSWLGVLSYALQIYFDFSAYSDLAIGLGWMFGIRLPINFASPYKARSIDEFWQRWHITLSRFLRDYLYIPLGGNRCSRPRHYANLFATMLLGGIWHGAGFTFVLWGALHGLFLVVHRAWKQHAPALGWSIPSWPARLTTFALVALAWVPFRAPDLASTRAVYAGMLGLHGSHTAVPLFDPLASAAWIALLLAAVWLLPNTSEWMGPRGSGLPTRGYPATAVADREAGTRLLGAWRPSPITSLALGVLLFVCVVKMNDVSPFIYFQF